MIIRTIMIILTSRCQSLGTFWRLTAPIGKKWISSNFRWTWFCYIPLLLNAKVNYICNIGKGTFFAFKEGFNISCQVDVEGIVVENLARRCGGFLKSLSLNGCQVLFLPSNHGTLDLSNSDIFSYVPVDHQFFFVILKFFLIHFPLLSQTWQG